MLIPATRSERLTHIARLIGEHRQIVNPDRPDVIAFAIPHPEFARCYSHARILAERLMEAGYMVAYATPCTSPESDGNYVAAVSVHVGFPSRQPVPHSEDMNKDIDTAAIESLRSFAMRHGELAFAHLCTAALTGEEWAVERVNATIGRISVGDNTLTMACSDDDITEMKLDVIRTTDCTRPDGAIARGMKGGV